MKNIICQIAFAALMLFITSDASAQILTKSKNVKFFNQGGYVAQFLMFYEIDTNPNDPYFTSDSKTTSKLAVGESQTLTLPVGSKNVTIYGYTIGLNGERDKKIFEKNYPDASKIPACFKTYGTVFDPKWNNNCN